VRCGLEEFWAIVEYERQRHAAGRGAEPHRAFDVPEFVTDGLPQSGEADPARAEGETSAREQGWITPGGQLDDRWHEIIITLAHGEVYGFARITDPDAAEIRAVVAIRRGSAFRIVIRGEEVHIDEIRPDAPWPALVACLPKKDRAEGRSVTIPSAVLAKAERDSWLAYDVHARQVPPDDAQSVAELTEMADQMSAQITIALRGADGTLHVGPYVVDVHHAPSGRVAVLPQLPVGSRTTVTPADRSLIVEALQEYLDDLWAWAREEPTQRLA
jgi:hypothetical protein